MVDFPDSPAPAYLVSAIALGADRDRRQRTEQEHLDLVSLHHAILLQLVLNLLVPLLALLVFGAHTTTHFCGSCVVWSVTVFKRWRLLGCNERNA